MYIEAYAFITLTNSSDFASDLTLDETLLERIVWIEFLGDLSSEFSTPSLFWW